MHTAEMLIAADMDYVIPYQAARESHLAVLSRWSGYSGQMYQWTKFSY